MKKIFIFLSFLLLLCQCRRDSFETSRQTKEITDAAGRKVRIPQRIDHVICSGAGCLRLLAYLNCLDKVVAVDSLEKRKSSMDARPYAIANPQLKELPQFGEFRGRDNPEFILDLVKQPDVIFKTYSTSGYDPDELQIKTGIPVIVLNYGDLGTYKEDFFTALTIMAKVINKVKRGREVVDFFKDQMNELSQRTRLINEKKSCYVGGIAYRGPHGLQSTEPGYPPFLMINAKNVAYNSAQKVTHTDISKESLLQWNPDIIFVDLSSFRADIKVNPIFELKNDPVYRELDAVKKMKVYGLLPYNWYSRNFGSILADAWYIGKILYPDEFKDLDPAKKADQIYSFLLGKAVFKDINEQFENLVFTRLLQKVE